MKRDIRAQDHEPLQMADSSPLPYIILYLFEPSFIESPDTSLRHLQFQYQSILHFNSNAALTGKHIHLFHVEAADAFAFIQSKYDICEVFGYCESGTMQTWKRDKWVQSFCKQNNITWTECQKGGVLRGIKNREYWDKNWYKHVSEKIIENQKSEQCIIIENPFQLDSKLKTQLEEYPAEFQLAGESNAWRYLQSFAENRGKQYHKLISKPTESRTSCSRLSPFLAWGNISIRQAYQFIKKHPEYPKNKFAFESMISRLKWHCHFIQKFEMECRYETECINRGYETLNYENNPNHLIAWKEGKTGFPLVDACMRCLIATGWINFRMRAMLVSFLCHHLDIDWRLGTYHLAQLFLDYEPGIHYPQFQMQAGTTGINTIRIYNPIKQSREHDSEGFFIKKWIPELQNVHSIFIHEPWKMSLIDQQLSNTHIGVDYPEPIIDIENAAKKNKEKIWGHRNNPTVVAESSRIIKTHTRNNKSKSH